MFELDHVATARAHLVDDVAIGPVSDFAMCPRGARVVKKTLDLVCIDVVGNADAADLSCHRSAAVFQALDACVKRSGLSTAAVVQSRQRSTQLHRHTLKADYTSLCGRASHTQPGRQVASY
eukprot:COSAG02_NODE_1028_length_15086_cov_21.563555_5_plen_121_part_00